MAHKNTAAKVLLFFELTKFSCRKIDELCVKHKKNSLFICACVKKVISLWRFCKVKFAKTR